MNRTIETNQPITPTETAPSSWPLWGALRYARLNRQEIAGSLGDLGTFLPLLVGMSAQNGLDFASALFFAGLFNVLTGLTFTIPMAVQPMKAIAAVALTEGLTVPQILAAGATVSFVILLLGLSGWIEWLNRLVPKSVVRGLQLALGLSLLLKGIGMVSGSGWAGSMDGWLVGIVACCFALILIHSRVLPAALFLFGLGLVLTLISRPDLVRSLGLSGSLPRWSPPAWQDFVTAFPKAALPQIPLTALNSVLAVCVLAADLFPDRPISMRKVAVSVGLMNLVACWFGGMPMCHGAGGLAGQYRFGARTNGSILFLGAVKLVLAVAFGSSLMALCQAFPQSVLGVMLAFAGAELALVFRDQTQRVNAFIMLITAAVCLALNVAVGLIVGLLLAAGWRLGLFPIEHDPSEQNRGGRI
ncbi:MAG: putative sulfate/molybdate transporter [Gemmatales bacterium]|nr:putative sulfate/molybdate transporter [Gemmatales bacterium]MDW7993954.1 putative sulfate/molybdate transporter [Gemmatales bacterium]